MCNGCSSEHPVMCPSANPAMDGAVVLGVVEGTVAAPRVGYLTQPLPVTGEILALSGPVSPTRVFRFAASCAEHACPHFDGNDCGLGLKIVENFTAVVDRLPFCRLRPHCRWWLQSGREACLRCPQIVTEVGNPTEDQRYVADPSTVAGQRDS